jgi:hypothetical protein
MSGDTDENIIGKHQFIVIVGTCQRMKIQWQVMLSKDNEHDLSRPPHRPTRWR